MKEEWKGREWKGWHMRREEKKGEGGKYGDERIKEGKETETE